MGAGRTGVPSNSSTSGPEAIRQTHIHIDAAIVSETPIQRVSEVYKYIPAWVFDSVRGCGLDQGSGPNLAVVSQVICNQEQLGVFLELADDGAKLLKILQSPIYHLSTQGGRQPRLLKGDTAIAQTSLVYLQGISNLYKQPEKKGG